MFLAPQGSNWLINKSTVAKYVNKSAPTGSATKVAVIKPAKLVKLVAKSLGDTPIDISSAPSGDVLAVYTVTNGAETTRHCTSFSGCAHHVIANGPGYKLVCKNGAPAACPAGSTTTTTISSTTTTTIAGPPLLGPAFPPPNGNVSYAFVGACAACSGGITVQYTSFVPDTTWSELYWGLDPAYLPTAGLDGNAHALTFTGVSGTTATWAGTTDWTNPMDSTTYNNVPIELRLTVTGLGGTPWVLSTAIPDLDPGVGTGIAAVADDSASLLDFDATFEFLADIPTDGGTSFIALNEVSNGGGQTNSSVGTAFYSRQ